MEPLRVILFVVLLVSLAVLVISALGVRAIIRHLPKAGRPGQILLILALLVCCGVFALSLGGTGCTGFFLVDSLGRH